MSLILDALRKSERTRQQSLTGQLGAGETPPAPARLGLPWTTVLGILLLVNALVLGLFFWRSNGQEPAAAKPAPVLQSQTTPYRPEVRPLSAEAPPGADNSATSPVPGAAAAPKAVPQPAVQPPAPTVAQNSSADLPTYDNLPADLRQSLPALHLDVHAYAAKPAERFVVINLQRYRIGDSLPQGVLVADIVPQGVVLEFHGTRFLLPP